MASLQAQALFEGGGHAHILKSKHNAWCVKKQDINGYLIIDRCLLFLFQFPVLCNSLSLSSMMPPFPPASPSPPSCKDSPVPARSTPHAVPLWPEASPEITKGGK